MKVKDLIKLLSQQNENHNVVFINSTELENNQYELEIIDIKYVNEIFDNQVQLGGDE